MGRVFAAAAAAICVLHGADLLAQESRSDGDPTRPVFFSVRPEIFRGFDGLWRAQAIARYDRAMLRKRRWMTGHRGLLVRLELPLASAGGPGAETSRGLGDAYAQVLVIPILSGRFGLATGSGLAIPSATSAALGTGKWTVAPAVVPVWFLRGRGMVHVRFQDYVSVGGDAARPDLHFMLFTPTLIHTVGRSSWVLIDSEWRTDWLKHRTSAKSGFQFGRIMPNGLGLWVKPEIWWGANRGGEWNLKTGIVWYRR